MKKTIMALVAGLLLAAPLTLPAQATDMKVGVIDVQRILNGSSLMKALTSAQQDVAQAEKALMDLRNQKLKELQDMQKNVQDGKMSQEDFLKKQREFEDEVMAKVKAEQTRLEGKKEEIRKMKDGLEKDVEEAVKKVAQQKGLDMVINKQLVLFGGADITGDVIGAMPQH